MNCKGLFGAFFVLVILFGCDTRTEKPEGIYQTTSYNTGKKVLFDFKKSGEVQVQVSHVNVSGNIVDDSFFPFFTKGENKYKWTIDEKNHLVSIQNESNFEIVKLEYTGKYLSWDKTKFTRE